MALRLKLGIGAAIALAGVIAFSIISRPDDLDFVIDPNSVRPWAEEEWKEWTADLRGAARTMTEDEFFGKVVLKPFTFFDDRKGLNVDTAWHETPMDDYWEPTAPGPPLELRSVGVYGAMTRVSQARSSFVVENYYDPRTGERIQPLAIRQNPLTDSPGYVLLDLELGTEKEQMRITSHRFFDSKTHVPIGFGQPLEFHEKTFLLPGWLSSFRPSGGLPAVDYQFGKELVGTLMAEKGARIQHGERVLRILEVNQFRDFFPALGGGRTLSGNSHFKIRGASGPPGANFLIGAYPYGPLSGFRFQLLGKDGTELETFEYELPALGYLIRGEGPQEIARIEVSCAERFGRQLVSIPPIPGLPTENDTVTNMLDIRFPPALGPSQVQVLNLGSATQTEVFGGRLAREARPPDLPNPSARDLLRYMQYRAGPGARVEYYPESFTISIEDPPQKEWFAKLRQRLPPVLGGPQKPVTPVGGAPVFDDAAGSGGGGFAPAFRWPWQKPEPAPAAPVGGAPVFDDAAAPNP